MELRPWQETSGLLVEVRVVDGIVEAVLDPPGFVRLTAGGDFLPSTKRVCSA